MNRRWMCGWYILLWKEYWYYTEVLLFLIISIQCKSNASIEKFGIDSDIYLISFSQIRLAASAPILNPAAPLYELPPDVTSDMAAQLLMPSILPVLPQLTRSFKSFSGVPFGKKGSLIMRHAKRRKGMCHNVGL